ncbi:hypothetical protein AAMO2058_001640900 [Amorphochlora amoebiformis]
MGSCSSNEHHDAASGDPNVKDHHTEKIDIVVNMMKATNIPDCDTSLDSKARKADSYAKFYLSENADGKTHLTKAVKTSFRVDTEFPVWNSYRRLTGLHDDNKALYLVVQIFDYDKLSKDDFIGMSITDISEAKSGQKFQTEVQIEKQFQKHLKGKCLVEFEILKDTKWPSQKTIFFVRHGESKWNEAEHGILQKGNLVDGVTTMAGGRDHPLNYVGINQARELNAKWKAKDNPSVPSGEKPSSDDIDSFYQATKIYASPLTRATQTCLIGLQDHPTLTRDGVTLMRQLREVKNRIGWDTLGDALGEQIRVRVREKLLHETKTRPHQLKDFLPKGEEDLDILTNPKIDTNDCETYWWDEDHNKSVDISERLTDLIHALRFSDHEIIICVGHSLFFREMCRAFIGGGHPKSTKEIKELLKTDKNNEKEGKKGLGFEGSNLAMDSRLYKLGNAACLMAKFDFSKPLMKDWKITSAKLMFGSRFNKKEKQDMASSDSKDVPPSVPDDKALLSK